MSEEKRNVRLFNESNRSKSKLQDHFRFLLNYYGQTALLFKREGSGYVVESEKGSYSSQKGDPEQALRECPEWMNQDSLLLPVCVGGIPSSHIDYPLYERDILGYLAIKMPLPESGSVLSLKEYMGGQNMNFHSSRQLLPDGLVLMSSDRIIQYKNFIAEYMLRRANIGETDMDFFNCLLDDFSKTQPIGSIRVFYPQMVGFDVFVMLVPLLTIDGMAGCMVILSDISMQKQSEKELIEKSTVIREIHHRVKNNLQTITSLLRLQIRRSNQRLIEKSFNESINRILSIALIHEALSRQDIETINIKQTSYNILQTILNNMVEPDKIIHGSVSGEDIFLPSDTASSISLCITELVQNAVEHAFNGRPDGNIRIDMVYENDDIVIKVEDNGTGIKSQAEGSLGMEIVRTTVGRKLQGSFDLESHRYGTAAIIRCSRKVAEGLEF